MLHAYVWYVTTQVCCRLKIFSLKGKKQNKYKKNPQKTNKNLKFNFNKGGIPLTNIKKRTNKMNKVNKDSNRIIKDYDNNNRLTKIIYLYISQKNVLSTNLWNKNKSQKKSHVLEI